MGLSIPNNPNQRKGWLGQAIELALGQRRGGRRPLPVHLAQAPRSRMAAAGQDPGAGTVHRRAGRRAQRGRHGLGARRGRRGRDGNPAARVGQAHPRYRA